MEVADDAEFSCTGGEHGDADEENGHRPLSLSLLYIARCVRAGAHGRRGWRAQGPARALAWMRRTAK
jgi:hypothetical protein